MSNLMCSGKYLLTEQAEIVSENKLKDLGFMVHGSALCEILCCVAPSEDKYGVVQLALPEILNTVSATLKSIDQVCALKLSQFSNGM